MKQHKPIIVKIEENSFDRYINNAILQEGTCTIKKLPVKKRSNILFIIRTIISILPLFFLRKRKIIVFDSEGVAKLLSRYSRNVCVLFYWNVSKRNKDVIEDIKRKCVICTFDNIEAKEYNMHYIPQFYIPQKKEHFDTHIKYDIFFIGADKGRVQQIKTVQLACYNQRISTNFKVVVEKIENYPNELRNFLTTNYLPYEEVLQYIDNSKALLEIVKDGQSGLTIRSMEALFYNKKLITNNHSIVTEPFYTKNNIFVLGKDKIDTLSSFLAIEPIAYDNCQLEKHNFSTWLDRIIRLTNN